MVSELDGSTAQELVDQGERYLTSVLYRKLFGPANCDDEERDLAIQKRIRGLGWISAPLLDCRINELHSKVRDILEKAITGTPPPPPALVAILGYGKERILCDWPQT